MVFISIIYLAFQRFFRDDYPNCFQLGRQFILLSYRVSGSQLHIPFRGLAAYICHICHSEYLTVSTS
nr:MAG TPA: hypothetical protein [Caudoviricetes sp.]